MAKKMIESDALSEVFGEDGTRIISLIKKPMEDKEISAELDFETSKVRRILNELLEKNLVYLYRYRHDTGYTDYSWEAREDKIGDYVNDVMEKRLKRLDKELLTPEHIMFECGCNKVDYGMAIDYGFSCPKCEKTFREANPMKGSRKIKAEIKRIEALISAS